MTIVNVILQYNKPLKTQKQTITMKNKIHKHICKFFRIQVKINNLTTKLAQISN